MASHPLRFKILPQARAPTNPVCCLSVSLNEVSLIRIIDPERGEPFVAASLLFTSQGLTPLEGLHRFSLTFHEDYERELGGMEPWEDIWLVFPAAIRLAKAMKVFEKLKGFLDWKSRGCYSIYDAEQGGIVHNWRIGEEELEKGKYSLDALLKTDFSEIVLLEEESTLNTPFSHSAITFPTSHNRLLSTISAWSILLHCEERDYFHAELLPAPTGTSSHKDPQDNQELMFNHSMDLSYFWDIHTSSSSTLLPWSSTTTGGRISKTEFVKVKKTKVELLRTRMLICLWEGRRVLQLDTVRVQDERGKEDQGLESEVRELKQRLERMESRASCNIS
ncbi:hypothetical protein BT69DRAFT_1276965 [Atractiella rhizophila]|nr:hypothetical protein BT69DRAFT_1276965 [Atractiella rhizophila]